MIIDYNFIFSYLYGYKSNSILLKQVSLYKVSLFINNERKLVSTKILVSILLKIWNARIFCYLCFPNLIECPKIIQLMQKSLIIVFTRSWIDKNDMV